ncbi:hypothetical protein L1987_02489 [Smallanthus sonchifolius]|uniref:Uncharacterized protein n=1 Tax=Smallanthus sonchifolius TaxID=185202 RepID=A0ACB9K825_9ASTR|nr:hypothetical protein L1987_02489 [Smallanthus sonchifolius]
MLGSSSCSHNHHNHHHFPPSIYLRRLLLTCAHYISHSDFTAARRITTILSATSSPSGDSSERLIHSFTKALSIRLHLHHHPPPTLSDDAILQASYLSLNRITPFVRFCHLTANQAILEVIEQQQQEHPQNIHILDFDIMHGVQWPPLMQAIAGLHPPPTLRITATGTNLDILLTTGDRLSKFAHSLDRDKHKLCLLLKKIKSMNPKVVTLAENEANHNHPVFISRFEEALSYYTAVFDSLEATMPPNSRERVEVEQVWFGKEIADIVAAEGGCRRERHERFLSWEMMMRIAGFQNVALSPFALTQAKLLLRLHYPCEGYNLEVVNDFSFWVGRVNPFSVFLLGNEFLLFVII